MDKSLYSVTEAWEDGWDEDAICAWAADLRQKLGDNPISFGLLFVTPSFFGHSRELLEILRVHAHVPVLLGCSTNGLVSGDRELELGNGFVLGLYSIPGARFQAESFSADDDIEEVAARLSTENSETESWLVFVDPFDTDAESWLEAWQSAFPGVPVYGGIAAGLGTEKAVQLYHDGRVFEEGGVALAISGVRCLGMVAQGCEPIGDTWTVTQVEKNVVRQIGNRSAVDVLTETYDNLDEGSRRRSSGNLFAGFVVDEYREDYRRGDFLIRNLIGADPDSGSVVVSALPRIGQTLQFQLRDSHAADEDLRELLEKLSDRVGRSIVYGGCLCICGGRGEHLFGEGSHDAKMIQKLVGPASIAGFFGNGEFGPVGERSYVHTYTASLLLFVGPERTEEDEL